MDISGQICQKIIHKNTENQPEIQKTTRAPPSAAPHGGRASRAPRGICCFGISGGFSVFLWMILWQISPEMSNAVVPFYFPSGVERWVLQRMVKQECRTEKAVSNIHWLGPKNTQKLQLNWKTISTGGGAKRRPLWGAAEGGALLFFNSFAIFVYFVGPSLCMLLTTFPLGVA